jgi:hypothetical protein
MTKLKKDTESVGQGIKKVIENIGHEIKENTELAEHESGIQNAKNGTKSAVNKVKKVL